MIVSTVNFVNNYKFSDFIIDKITEEQTARDALLQTGAAKRHSFCAPASTQGADVTACRRRASLRSKRSGDFTSSSTCQSPASTVVPPDNSRLVTLETADDYILTADTQSLHVCLKRSSSVSSNCVFRRIDFPDDLSVFQLHSNPTYYLATTHLRHIVIQSYCADTLDTTEPDERFFQSFQTDYGAELLQPVSHKGYLIHHMDTILDLRKLELALRPPEEFYVSIKPAKPEDIQTLPSAPVTSTTGAAVDRSKVEASTPQRLRQAIPDISKNSLKRKESKKAKDKTKQSPITPKPGMLSCFGIGSKRKKKNKR